MRGMLMGPKLDVFECDECKGSGKKIYRARNCNCYRCAEPDAPTTYHDIEHDCKMCKGRGFTLKKAKSDGQ